MTKVSVFGKFTCAEGKESELDAALVDLVAASETVDGVESYSYHKGDGGTYWFFGLMTNMEAAQKHNEDEGMKAAMQAFMPLMAGPPDMGMATPVAAHGFEI